METQTLSPLDAARYWLERAVAELLAGEIQIARIALRQSIIDSQKLLDKLDRLEEQEGE